MQVRLLVIVIVNDVNLEHWQVSRIEVTKRFLQSPWKFWRNGHPGRGQGYQQAEQG